jgi:uncharacterized protein (DUF58 family)
MNHASPSWGTVKIRGKNFFKWGIFILVPLWLFTSVALLQFICLVLLFILIGSRLYSEYLIRNIRVSRVDPELRVFRYEWVKVELKLENHGLLPAFMLVASDTAGGVSVLRMRKTFCTLLRHSWIPLKWEGFCTDRGDFTIGPAVVWGADPLGLFPFHLTAGETSRLLVYPMFRSITLNAPAGIPLGNMVTANPLYEDITRCRSLRPYVSGDEPRRINWKVSARMFHFMVNEYEATASYPLMIFLNADRNEYPVKKQGVYIERAIEAAAALCLRAAQERQELGIIFYTSGEEGGVSVIAPAAFTLASILERLASLNWTKTAHVQAPAVKEYLYGSAKVMLDQGKHLSFGTRFLYAGPDLGDEAYICLNSLRKYHLSLEYLIIDERAMPSLVPGNSLRYQMKEEGYEIV